jgi:hypothetical protein
VPKRVAAFPGALGFGGRVTGGRGGRVLFVDNLDESGPGSLQAAVDEQGPRTILFRTSGVIEDPEVLIRSGDLTIAGQTAPGTGIILRGRLVADYGSNVENVIVRHLHVRPDPDGSDPLQFDAIQFSRVRGAILDHVSAAFGIDETVDLFEAQDISVGFSTIESSATEGHPEGVHNHALIAGPDSRNISIYNTLFAHHGTAAPALSGGPAELVGSVLYDVEQAVTHRDPARGRFQYVGNTFRTGPNATLMPFTFDDEREPPDPGLGYYLSGNRVDGTDSTCAAGPVDDPWSTCTHDLRRGATFRVQTAWDDASFPSRVPVPAETAEAAYARVLAEAGAFPRDKVARGVLEDVASRGGQWGANIPGDLGGGRFDPLTLPVDSDADGMPDEWELERGLDPTRGADRNRVLESGYTALEEYLAEVAEQVLAK